MLKSCGKSFVSSDAKRLTVRGVFPIVVWECGKGADSAGAINSKGANARRIIQMRGAFIMDSGRESRMVSLDWIPQ